MNRLPCTDALSKIHDGAERIKASHFVLHIITIKKKKKKKPVWGNSPMEFLKGDLWLV